MTHSASHIINGFRFQFMQALQAWLYLKADEELWLEVSEDYSVRSRHEQHDVQVKASRATPKPTPYSLQSADVKAALTRFWARASLAEKTRHRMTFVANGGAAKERGVTFPNDEPGLVYWARCALEADTQPLRDALAKVFAGEPLAAWLASSPSDEELRRRLLRPVQWTLNEQPTDAMATQLQDQVGVLYLSRGLPVLGAEQGYRVLLDIVGDMSRMELPQHRVLRATSLHVELEKIAATFNVARVAGASAAYSGTDKHGALVTTLEHGSYGTMRAGTVDDILKNASGDNTIWLYGAHGTGKSTLARLIAQRTPGRWVTLDLQPAKDDPIAALSAWRELLRDMATNGPPDGILIDDLDGEIFKSLHPRIASLLPMLAARGCRLVINSHVVPSPARLSDIGVGSKSLVQASYFTEDDVTDLVTGAGAPYDAVAVWSTFVRISTRGGHPLLVAAKIAGLRWRQWPRDALIEDIGGNRSEAVQLTLGEARLQLLKELSSFGDQQAAAANQVLRRIGSVFDRVDQDLALRLCALEPAVTGAGDAVAILKGSWLEPMPNGDLRLSPLLSDITSDVSPDTANEWRCDAAIYWMSKRVLDERTLPLAFWNAFWGKQGWVLTKLCEVIQGLRRDVLKGAAAMLSPMVALVTDAPLFPEHEAVNILLRILQFEVADAVENDRCAADAARRLLVELDEVSKAEVRTLFTAMAAPKVLSAEGVALPYDVALAYAVRLRAEATNLEALGNISINGMAAQVLERLGPNITVPGFLIASVGVKIKSSEDFLRFVKCLSAIPNEDRNDILNASSAIYHGPSVLVSSGWSRDQLADKDMKVTAACYAEAEQIMRGWGSSAILTEMAVARSVIADEGLKDTDSALAIVENAASQLGDAAALVRQRARVLAHAGRDREALELVLSIIDTVGNGSHLERALALRDGATSAAKIGRYKEATELFATAFDAVRDDSFHAAFAAGLLIDGAHVQWRAGERQDALKKLADAFDRLETLDMSESRQNQRAHQFGRATGGLFNFDALGQKDEKAVIAFGGASALDGKDEPLTDVDLRPLEDNWRILALVDVTIDGDGEVEQRSLAKQTGPGLISVEGTIATAHYARAVRRGHDVTTLLRLGCVAVCTLRESIKERTKEVAARGNAPRFEDIDCEALRTSPEWGEWLWRIAVDDLLQARYRGTWSETRVDAWYDALARVISKDAASAFQKAASGRYAIGDAVPFSFAVAKCLASDEDYVATTPVARFCRDQNVVAHTVNSLAHNLHTPLIVHNMRTGWSEILTNQRFRLSAPLRNCPPMESALADLKQGGIDAAARLLLAAAPAVGQELSEGWERLLRQIGGT